MNPPVIVIPMAGASSRFYNAGYNIPKYMLPLGNETLFDKSVKTFEKYFSKGYFIFVVRRDDPGAFKFVATHASELGICDYRIVELNSITKGQAETAMEAIGALEPNGWDYYRPLYIFNIDSIRKNLELPDVEYDALFDVFLDPEADEKKWSFCKLDDSHTYIVETAEKNKISNFCSTGLYIFKNCFIYKEVYEKAIKDNNYNYYIAPLYNYLWNKRRVLPLYCSKNDVEFSGIPDEYEELKIKYSFEEKMN